MAIEETMDVSAAFLLITLGASLGTLFGGFIVFSHYLLRVVNPRAMSVWLSFSGGLTIFQGLVVLFSNSLFEFAHAFSNSEDKGTADDTVMGQAWLTTTGCFGVGIVLNYCLDRLVKQLTPGQHQSIFARMHAGDTFHASLEAGTPELKSPVELMQSRHFLRMDESTKKKLQRLGVLNVIAIAIHSIPGGVATMVASSEHTFIGLALAIGVGLHNVAEGVALATSVYFATGSKWRGVTWRPSPSTSGASWPLAFWARTPTTSRKVFSTLRVGYAHVHQPQGHLPYCTYVRQWTRISRLRRRTPWHGLHGGQPHSVQVHGRVVRDVRLYLVSNIMFTMLDVLAIDAPSAAPRTEV